MPPGAPREHDPRITVIQQELFNEKRSKVDKYRELVVGQPGLWPLTKYLIDLPSDSPHLRKR